MTYVPGIFRGVASPKPKRTGSLLSRRSSVSLRRKRRNSRQLTGSERRFLRVSLRQPLFISCRRLRQPRVSSPFPRPSSWLTHLSTLSHSLPSLSQLSISHFFSSFFSFPFFLPARDRDSSLVSRLRELDEHRLCYEDTKEREGRGGKCWGVGRGGRGSKVVKRKKKWALTVRGRVKYGAGHRVDANNNNKGEIG